MPSYLTRSEYTISITTGSLSVRNDIVDYLTDNKYTLAASARLQSSEHKVPICPTCYANLTVGYTSVGSIYICDSCKWNNKKDYPQCVKCNAEPQEPMSIVGMCFSCDPAFEEQRQLFKSMFKNYDD